MLRTLSAYCFHSVSSPGVYMGENSFCQRQLPSPSYSNGHTSHCLHHKVHIPSNPCAQYPPSTTSFPQQVHCTLNFMPLHENTTHDYDVTSLWNALLSPLLNSLQDSLCEVFQVAREAINLYCHRPSNIPLPHLF